MRIRGWLIAAALVAPAAASYETSCVAVDATTVEGFVTNRGRAVLQVSGPVSYSFTVADSMSRPAVQAQAAALIQPGQTASVGRARLAGNVLPSELCRLDVSGAVR